MAKNRLQKLSHRLMIVMVIIPSLLTLLFVIAMLWLPDDDLKRRMSLFIVGGMSSFILLAFNTVRRLDRRIMGLQSLVNNFSLSNGSYSGGLNGNDELSLIGKFMIDLNTELSRKAEFVREMREGHLYTDFKPRSEHDTLGQSLVQIRNNLIKIKEDEKKQNWSAESLAQFVEILRSSTDIKDLSNNIIRSLVNIVAANQGAIYTTVKTDGEEEFLEMQACYAFKRTKFMTDRIAIGEGIIGQAYLERETIYLKDVPDSFVKITSGLGEANPRNVLIVPLKINQVVVGIIEMASFREFSSHEIAFVEKIGENIAHTISSIHITHHTTKLLTESQELTEQMRAQEEELKQNQEELQATQEEISRKYKQLFNELKNLNYESRFDQLRSITMTKKRSVEYYFDIIRNQILTFAENKMVIAAMKEFKRTFFELSAEDHQSHGQMQESVRRYYEHEFIPRLNESSDDIESATRYLPSDTITTILQYLYISNNPNPTGQKSALDDAGDGSGYSKTHASYHPLMRSFLEKFGYYDIFLIDDITGYMVYSVFKEVDFATSLLAGVYSNTNFGRVVKEAAENPHLNFVKLIDFEPYDPSYWAPASFIARPIYDADKKIGILVFQMPINKINQLLTGNNKWKEDGLGDSGETFIVGNDYKMRSVSRELTEDSNSYFSKLKSRGYSDGVIRQVKKTNTNILLEKIHTSSVRRALLGEAGTQLEKDELGTEKLHAYAPLEIPDVNWALLSQMREDEVSRRINNLSDANG
jgi:hypothetical protein